MYNNLCQFYVKKEGQLLLTKWKYSMPVFSITKLSENDG
ncbi:hypothetical protein NMS_2595 [Nonlabens marinus S1-08]|uniref:Uncharacterized protein n=1 Tax=Nonlabens marinus S1-08 TaxID=1454201 RepID=W8VS15_9FLAO|nr:hypothetical protein NMS_2595 [Nonlabens marinus S1-08]